MAYIAPNSTIRFHKNIALDNTFDHTYYFANTSEQNTFFSASAKILFQLDNYSYQRHTTNSIRIARPTEDIMNCNYISFKNSSFEDKWFYAFLTDYEYVNNNTTIIYYEIDPIQTYMFDSVTLEQCYIERQHTVTDNIGDNTVPEKLEIGEYIYEDLGLLGSFNTSYNIIIAATFTGEIMPGDTEYTFTDANGDWYNGLYSGVALNNFFDNVALANKFIIEATNKNLSEGIIAIYMLPAGCSIGAGETDAGTTTININMNTSWNIGNVSVKNKKLYTHPYNMLCVSNGQGNMAEYRWEFFAKNINNIACFTIKWVLCSSPEIGIMPRDYNLLPQSFSLKNNYNELLTITNFPMCAYNVDAYKAWLAQNSTKMDVAAVSAILGGIIGVVGGAVSGSGIAVANSVVSAGTKVANLLAENKVASTMPNHAKGQASNVLSIGMQNFGFRAYNVRVRDEYARIIDNYFTRYGYAIHQNAVPELCARTRFTYIKTVDCTIHAEIPNEYARKIVDIMNNGITFWNDKDHIGNYEIANNVWPG